MATLVTCSQKSNTPKPASNGELIFADNNGSITLPKGFRAVLVGDNLGVARHLAVNAGGDVYVNLGREKNGQGLVALRDDDGDGVAEQQIYFGQGAGTGIQLQGNYLYYSTNTKIYRQKFTGDELVPSGSRELIVSLPSQGQHAAKSFDLDGQGNLYVVIGAPSNACQDPPRTKEVPGQDPCPLLDDYGGIWKFSDSQPNQQQSDGSRYATGIRNAVGIDWNDQYQQLYAMQHGRDQLHQLWPEVFTEAESAELPAEELFEVQQGDDFGWPYCYYNHLQNQKLLAPEYGGDGQKVGRCDQYEKPIMAFPGHWAPNGLKFYQASSFPAKYLRGAFIAFHGSWNRAPFPQQGYKVVFVPFKMGRPRAIMKILLMNLPVMAASSVALEVPSIDLVDWPLAPMARYTSATLLRGGFGAWFIRVNLYCFLLFGCNAPVRASICLFITYSQRGIAKFAGSSRTIAKIWITTFRQ
ncbi:MAG: PQQ-dependent sugar dehydrogenase [Owenweeksia sp.]|nr:PQQ-dependent sugar dehydrogenase [Owenweeksia sp.]